MLRGTLVEKHCSGGSLCVSWCV